MSRTTCETRDASSKRERTIYHVVRDVPGAYGEWEQAIAVAMVNLSCCSSLSRQYRPPTVRGLKFGTCNATVRGPVRLCGRPVSRLFNIQYVRSSTFDPLN